MIKGLLFDFDNVLCDLAETHYEALNSSIREISGNKFIISRNEQDNFYNGLSTKTKLKILVREKNLPSKDIDSISKLKQKYTIEFIQNNIKENKSLIKDLSTLKKEGYILYCASNAMYETVELGLSYLGIFDLFDKVIGNDKIERQKPAPDIYLQSFLEAKLDPKECLIIEDSKHGRESAYRSGANICTVDNPNDVTYSYIKKCINKYEKSKSIKWVDSKLNVLLLCAGAGTRFASQGFKLPKPLIDVLGKPMIQWVIESLNIEANYIFLVQKKHCEDFNLKTILNLLVPNCTIIEVDGLTDGAARTSLLAKEFINNNDHLLIANSDQYVEFDSCDFMSNMLTSKIDGGIVTFKDLEKNPKWSFTKTNEQGFVTEVAEKNPISDEATIGIYYFNKGSDYVKYAEQMIDKNIRVNGEFYTCPIFNEFIQNDKIIKTYQVDKSKCHGLGVPEDRLNFIKNFK